MGEGANLIRGGSSMIDLFLFGNRLSIDVEEMLLVVSLIEVVVASSVVENKAPSLNVASLEARVTSVVVFGLSCLRRRRLVPARVDVVVVSVVEK